MRRTVHGQSMRPFLRDLDTCISSDRGIDKLSPGDIVVYRVGDNNNPSVHRVVGLSRSGNKLKVKGDNVPLSGMEEISPEDIMGKVVSVERSGETTDLTTPFEKIKARASAYLSSKDLTPVLFRKRFIDPALLYVASIPGFKASRIAATGRYSGLYFSVFRSEKKGHIRLYAFLNGTYAAKTVLSSNEDSVAAHVYIRYRDRNDVFVRKLVTQIRKVISEEFGEDKKIVIMSQEIRSWNEKENVFEESDTFKICEDI